MDLIITICDVIGGGDPIAVIGSQPAMTPSSNRMEWVYSKLFEMFVSYIKLQCLGFRLLLDNRKRAY